MQAFISYSHDDESYVERLLKHLSMLKREGLLTSFYDRDIMLGDILDAEIERNLEASQLFIAMVSPDFLASDYCVDRELATALEMHTENRLRVVSIILEPCEWKKSPLGNFLVAPKDGQAVALWENENAAFLNAVSEIRRIATEFASQSFTDNPKKKRERVSVDSVQPAKKYIAKRTFDEVDKYKFRDESFKTIRAFFKNSSDEIARVQDIDSRFRDIDEYSFTCTIMNEAFGRGLAHLTVRSGGTAHHSLGDISWAEGENVPAGTVNGWASIKHDDFDQFFDSDWFSFNFPNIQTKKMTPDQLASLLWDSLVERANITYA